jgi:hypothetical protein
MRDMKSFTFVANEKPVAPRREGVPVSRVCFYNIDTGDDPHFYAIELTEDNQVAWVDFAD